MNRAPDRQYKRVVGPRTELSRSREATSRLDFRPRHADHESRRHDNHGGSRKNDMRQDDARFQYDRSPRSPPRRRDHRDDLRLRLWTRPEPGEEIDHDCRDDGSPRDPYYDRRNRRSEEREQRKPREGNREDEREAPRHQQIAWGKQITRQGMIPRQF